METYYGIWLDKWREQHGVSMVLATHPDNEDLYRWEGGVWRNITPKFARVLLVETSWSLSRHAVEETLFEATNRARYLTGDRYDLGSREPRINFRNGVLHLRSGDLHPHGDPWNTINQVPHDYVADLDDLELEAITLPLDSYLRERVAQDTAEAGVLWQVLGRVLLPGNPSQTCVILQGPGGSGKSTVLGLMADLIGADNLGALSLTQLGSRFAASRLHGTTANIAGDVAGGVVASYELILSIVGGDSITADRKYRNPLAFTWDGLLILATNGRLSLPAGAGSESGWWRRAVYIDMPYVVPAGERRNADELRRTIAPDLDHVATRAARELRSAWLAGTVPVVTESMAKSSAAARSTGDTVTDWAEDRLVPSIGAVVTGKDAYRDYTEWCSFFGHNPRGHRAFYADLGSVLTRHGWGERIEGRDSTSRATFGGVSLPGHRVWSAS